MFHRRWIRSMNSVCVGIYVEPRTHTVGLPIDTMIEILSPVDHFRSPVP